MFFEPCSRFTVKPEFLIDNTAHKHGHIILKTPLYHPELQPIEACWAIVKNHIAKHNDCTMKKVQTLLGKSFRIITNKINDTLIKKFYIRENIYWAEDTEDAQ